jgi:hypothetical protein
MGTLSRTWEIMRASWAVLKRDPELLVFPVLSFIAFLLVMGSFLLPLLGEGGLQSLGWIGESGPLAYVLGFLFYVATAFVVIFFNSALIGCALARMTGKDPTVGFGLRVAWRRLPQIFLWTLATGTVGLLLRIVEERVGFAGRLVVAVLGMAWSVTSFFVIPALVHKGSGPVEAYTESATMLKQTWGEQITGAVSFSLLFGLLGLPPVALIVGVALTGSGPAIGVAFASSLVYLILLVLVQSTLQSIFQAALYVYAQAGSAPAGFDEHALEKSFRLR